MYTMKELVHDIIAMADALCMEEPKQNKFTHESGFNSIQGKYSLVCDTRGLIIASEDAYEKDCHKEVKDISGNEIRYYDDGSVAYPPVKPEPPKPLKTSNWVNITEKRREKIYEYEVALEKYQIAMAEYPLLLMEWYKLPTHKDFPPRGRPVIEPSDDNPVFIYKSRGSIRTEVRVLSRPIKVHKAHLLTWEESLNFHPNKPKVEPQTTLDGVVRFVKPLRTVDMKMIASFGMKPNHLLEREWLLHILNGEELSRTAKQLLDGRMEMMEGL